MFVLIFKKIQFLCNNNVSIHVIAMLNVDSFSTKRYYFSHAFISIVPIFFLFFFSCYYFVLYFVCGTGINRHPTNNEFTLCCFFTACQKWGASWTRVANGDPTEGFEFHSTISFFYNIVCLTITASIISI